MSGMTEEAPKRPDTGDGEQAPQPGTDTPFLPASFFSKLIHQPSCLTKGVCNNCGRCEH